MNEELQAKLRASAPEVWGEACIEIEPGWFDVAMQLGLRLKELGSKILIVKQKYANLDVSLLSGSCRGYRPPSPTEEKAIEEANERACMTCEQCGEPGRLVQYQGWDQTACTTCVTSDQNECKEYEQYPFGPDEDELVLRPEVRADAEAMEMKLRLVDFLEGRSPDK